jgi:hypothetical protein
MGGVRGMFGGGNKCIQRFGENKTGNVRINITYRGIRLTAVAI